MQRVLENLRKINEILLTVGELGLGIYLAKQLSKLEEQRKESSEKLEEQYREALRAVRERQRLGASAESGLEQEAFM